MHQAYLIAPVIFDLYLIMSLHLLLVQFDPEDTILESHQKCNSSVQKLLQMSYELIIVHLCDRISWFPGSVIQFAISEVLMQGFITFTTLKG